MLANCVSATLLCKTFPGLRPWTLLGGAHNAPQTPSSTVLAAFMRGAHKGRSQVRLRRTQVTPFKKFWIRPCIIYIEIVLYWRWQFVWKKRKNTISQFWAYISTLKKKTDGKYLTTQYNNINGTRYTYSRRKTWKYKIWWLPGQFYTHMYCRSRSELD